MSNTLALDPSPAAETAAARPARRGFAAVFMAALESLVAAQSRRFENTEPLSYRFPPI